MYARGVASITRRKKPLARLIGIYNRYCCDLDLPEAWNASWKIPKPRPLPANPDKLKDDAGFLESINLQVTDHVPRWSTDPSIRLGIRAMMKLDRCKEEEWRLQREATNMLQWFKEQVTAINVALRQADSKDWIGSSDCIVLTALQMGL
jgi:hypothetical protein